jgi:hypothetical protein
MYSVLEVNRSLVSGHVCAGLVPKCTPVVSGALFGCLLRTHCLSNGSRFVTVTQQRLYTLYKV